MITDADSAWAAGLFEGEGSIQIRPNGVWLSLGMQDLDVVSRFHALVGAGGVCQSKNREKVLNTWHLGKRCEVLRVLTMLMPWLGERRRAKASEGIAWIESFRRQCGRDGCGVVFLAGRSDRIYCCSSCYTAAHRAQARARSRAA